jgi:phosphatidate cytidylyltransferase
VLLLVLAGRTEFFVREAAETYWGLMLIGYCLSHLAALSVLPASWNPRGGAAGWFVFIVLVTQTNDIVQALFGRRFGRSPLARRISPGKTWEGFAAGFLTTLVVSLALGAALTPLTSATPWQWNGRVVLPGWWPAIAAGCLLSVTGLIGDLTISGLKRDFGVKDSGTWLPGQGGILDRVDSLLFASPAMFYFVKLLSL